jgi:hypothetical protein
MLARLDSLSLRHRSVTLHAAAPEVDFRTSMRCERIPGRHDPCSRNSPSHARHAEPPATGISLAEIAGIIRSRQRPARAGPRDWHNACGNCGNPRHGPPATATESRAGRKGRKGRKPIFRAPIAMGKYSCRRTAPARKGWTTTPSFRRIVLNPRSVGHRAGLTALAAAMRRGIVTNADQAMQSLATVRRPGSGRSPGTETASHAG